MEPYYTECRHFSGYKPCKFKRPCQGCPHFDKPSTRVAIISLEALGAVLRSTCLLPAIHRHYPGAHVTWITMPNALKLLENNPLIDRVIPYTAASSASLLTLQFDYIFSVDKSFEAGGLAESIKGTVKRGFGLSPLGTIRPLNSEASYQYDVGLDDELKFFRNQKPETQQITESMGLEWRRDPYVLELTELEKSDVRQKRGAFPIFNKYLGYNTGCSTLYPYKKLTITRSIEVIREWRRVFPEIGIVLLGGREDTERQSAMKDAFKDDSGVINTPTTGGLREGILWMAATDLVFSGCSLGLHMAIALRKHAIAWFGVSCAQEIDLYDRGLKVMADVTCSPCWKKSCDNEPKCFNQVSPNSIVEATRAVLDQIGNP